MTENNKKTNFEGERGGLVTVIGFGEMLANSNNRITLSNQKDKYGVFKINVDAHYGKNDTRIITKAKQVAKKILTAFGATHIKNDISLLKPHLTHAPMIGLGIHEMGTARMGSDPTNSVLNKHNQVWGIDNLYCTDGACMPSNTVANPSLTYMALTQRAVKHAIRHRFLKKAA